MAAPAVFISAKSEDYAFAREIFALLTSQGIPCFFCDESLLQAGDANYKNAIDSAIDSALHLIVVTSSRANTESQWVKYEWDTFHNELLSGRKKGNLLVVACGDLKPGDLPLALRQKQVLRFDTERDRIVRYLPGCIGTATATSTPNSASEGPDPNPGSNQPPAGTPEGALAHAGARTAAARRRGEIKAHFRGCSLSLAVVFGIVVMTGSSLFYIMRSTSKREGFATASAPSERYPTAAAMPMATPSPTAMREPAPLEPPSAPPEKNIAQIAPPSTQTTSSGTRPPSASERSRKKTPSPWPNAWRRKRTQRSSRKRIATSP
jgi:TIR domain